MLIRVQGNIEKVVHKGSRNTSLLVNDSNGFILSLLINNRNKLIDEINEGKEVDLICKLITKSSEKGERVYYENLIFIEDKVEKIMSTGGIGIGE